MKYLINRLGFDKYEFIITLLEYETRITDYLKKLKFPSFRNRKVLIDAALCSGLNEYRFIESNINSDGVIDLNQCQYVDVDKKIMEIANLIISKEPLYFNNSVLTKSQKCFFQNLIH